MVLSLELRIKARQAVDELVGGIGEELDRRERLDQIEKSLFRRLLELGKSLLQQAVDEVADDEEQAAGGRVFVPVRGLGAADGREGCVRRSHRESA